MRLLSLAALTILDAGPAGQMRAAAAAGWKSVGLRLQPLVETDPVIAGRADRERELRDIQAETGLALLEASVFPIRPDFDLAQFEPALNLAAQLGAQFIVSPIEDHDRLRRAESLARLAEAAGRRGLRALVEFNPYSACASLGDALDLLERSGVDETGLCLDALHLFRSGGSVEDARAAASRIRLLHFCDAAPPPSKLDPDSLRRESRTARRLPGDGVLPLGALVDCLPDAPISLEAPSARLHGSPEARARLALSATKDWFASHERSTNETH